MGKELYERGEITAFITGEASRVYAKTCCILAKEMKTKSPRYYYNMKEGSYPGPSLHDIILPMKDPSRAIRAHFQQLSESVMSRERMLHGTRATLQLLVG